MTKVTIYSIAERLDISASTVSRAFTRPDLVKPKVRELVLETAAEMGYQPNRAARRLRTGLTGSIGLFVPDITNPYFPPLVRAIQHAASESDATVLLVDAKGDARSEEALIAKLATQVDGLIVASPLSGSDAIKRAIGKQPAVLINRPLRGVASVVCDTSDALKEAGRHLSAMGHRRVALLRGTSGSWAAKRRGDAVRAWAATADVDLVELGPFEASFEGGRAAADAFERSEATAAFAFDDLTACGVVARLAELGLSVPADRSVVGCDDVLLARVLTPALTTVNTPNDEIGETAVRLLDQLIAGDDAQPVRLPGTFVPRSSTGPAPHLAPRP